MDDLLSTKHSHDNIGTVVILEPHSNSYFSPASDEPEYKKSAGSLESEDKPLESESESMAEYEDTDPMKFNEDGSFIGMYGGKNHRPEEKPLMNDSTQPSALSTFV